MHLARSEGLQDYRRAPRRASDGDPVACDVLGKTELADAEGEHRGEGPFEVELPFLDLTEIDEELRVNPA
jgi:hypothetical protein